MTEIASLKKEYTGYSAIVNYLYHSATNSEDRAIYSRELDEINSAIETLIKLEEETE